MQPAALHSGWLAAGVDALGTGPRRGADDAAAAEGGGSCGEGGAPPLDSAKSKGNGDGAGGKTSEEGATNGGAAGAAGAKKKEAGPPASWGATAGGDELLMVRADVELFVGRVERELVPFVEEVLTAACGAPAAECASECISIGVEQLRGDTMPRLTAALVAAVVERCLEALKQLKGITATFRMTNKPLPTRHSHFVPGILAPLRAFVDADRAKALTPASRKELAFGVSDGVSARYGEMAAELVMTVKKTEVGGCTRCMQ
jgi:hypothetical protein